MRKSSLRLLLRGTFPHLLVCFRPWRAHLNPTLLFPAAPLRSAEVVLVAMEDTRKWRGCSDRLRRGNMCVRYVWMCMCSLCVYEYVSLKLSVLSACSMCYIIFAPRFVYCMCVVCVLRQPAEQGEHLHTVAQAFCLYTRLLPSNASRLSRLWPPRGSRGALPLKSQLCLILSARQIFHSPAVHLRTMEHSTFTFSLLNFWSAIVQV